MCKACGTIPHNIHDQFEWLLDWAAALEAEGEPEAAWQPILFNAMKLEEDWKRTLNR